MKLREIYSKPIDRAVNPAVSATKFDPETERIEIQEYVFTDEIINGLFRILGAVKNNEPYDHVGIWIDGYYGSGKSHFLKYLDYCITPRTQEEALQRLLDAVRAIDPMDDKHHLNFDYPQLLDIAGWLKKATIDTCIFNLETSYDQSTDKKKAFLHVFWNEFNGKRGFNKFNITLAQNLEKPLQEKGVFEQFKQRILEEADADWNDPGVAADIIDNELDWVLDLAKEYAPTLDKESIRERIIKRDTTMSIERFGMELAAYLKDKGDNYRLILLADEVSQFINKERDRYLNLQEIITKLSEACDNKVWVACTAQQDLSEIMDDCHINEEKDKEGKIKGRFEVKVSLKGTQPEVITQKRILDKKEEVKPELSELYNKQKQAFALQFKLPTAYSSYETEEDFVAYYPFVPYQFKLIMQVFNSFLQLGYVAKEVKGNERSIIKVIHATAKGNAEAELGKFISFDELYNNMFEEGLQARGQKAVTNAEDMAKQYDRDPKLAKRIVSILFMICNISKNDQLLFPATIDNVTSLLINDMQTPRLTIKNEVEKIIEFLCDKNIIRREPGQKGAPDTYLFYSEEEMKAATLIQNQTPDNNMQAEQLKDIFFKYITSLKNKEQYGTRSFSVGASIKQRNFLTSNADIIVDFVMDRDFDSAELYAIQNTVNHMAYFLGPQFYENKRLFNSFYWYCQLNSYMNTPPMSEEETNIRKEFVKRGDDLYQNLIVPQFKKILDTCPVVSGNTVIDDMILVGKSGNDRYKLAVGKHLSSIYTKSSLVGSSLPRTSEDLKHAILRPLQPGDYDGMNADLTAPENEVEIYLRRQGMDVNVADVITKFEKAPYGWDRICTLYVINELVRRHKRDYSYSNNPNVETSTVASRIVPEASKFTLREAKAISSEVIQKFTTAWKDIFGTTDTFGTTDSTQIFRICREQDSQTGLPKRIKGFREIESHINGYAFAAPIKEAIDLFEDWHAVRDPLNFFNTIIAGQQAAHELIDKCREVVQFTHDQLDTYKDILQFAKDNETNFDFLKNDDKPKAAELMKVLTDEWPMGPSFRTYINLQKMLKYALDGVRKQLIEQITNAYNDIYDYLEKVAGQQEIPVPLTVLAKKEAVISSKINTTNLLVLRSNVSTDSFYQQEVAKILEYVANHTKPTQPDKPVSGGAGSAPEPPQPAKPQQRIRQASLNTKTAMPLKTEADIDVYLEGLRQQLFRLMVDKDGVMIIK